MSHINNINLLVMSCIYYTILFFEIGKGFEIFTRWIHHGRPRGGDVAAIVDAGILRSEVIFTVRYG